jgi:hypothetical protein
MRREIMMEKALTTHEKEWEIMRCPCEEEVSCGIVETITDGYMG